MKYADGPSVEVETEIAAPIETVWALISDIATPVRFSAEVQSVEWDDPAAEIAVGARFTGHNRHERAGEWSASCVVVAYDPPHTFGWAVNDPDNPAASWCFTVETTGDGVRLRQWGQIGPGPSGLTPAIAAMPDKEEQIVDRRMAEHRGNMEATVEGIKTLAEGTIG